MERIGFIKLHRILLDNPVWKLEKPFTKGQAWVDLLLLTNYAPGLISTANGTTIKVKRGQCGYSKVALADRWGWSRKKVTTFLNLLTNLEMVQQKNSLKHCIINILNFEKYQEVATTEQQKVQQRNIKRYNNGTSKGTSTEHQQNINRTSTEHQQNINGTQEKKNKKNKKNKKIIEAKKIFHNFFADDSDIKEHENFIPIFDKWLDFKNSIKKQYKTESGLKGAFLELINLAQNDVNRANELVEYAISKEWQGIYPIPKNVKNNQISQQKQYNEENGWKL